MDEDYDACDLENWFIAVQSADGNVMIPSFHRPAIIRIDPNNKTNDWTRTNQSNPNGGILWADSAARILRPCQADGHDAATFPDLLPDSTTGQITYDVDNDGDGKPDSVWLDLGYPARKDQSGRLYKPLFAFMVIGLNGRIPLNTAGNLASQVAGVYLPANAATLAKAAGDPTPATFYSGPGHAQHLGNSVSEVDPTYALQNAFDPTTSDPVAAFSVPVPEGTMVPPYGGVLYPAPPATGGTTYYPSNSQFDNAGIDVRLTQLRNILAGTRSTSTPPPPGNGDANYVYYSTAPAKGQQTMILPNGIADVGAGLYQDTLLADPNGTATNPMPPYVIRSTTPIPGRWGEPQSIPGSPFPTGAAAPNPAQVNVVGTTAYDISLNHWSPYQNPVRAGYSLNITDIINGVPPDAADDNFNTYDPYPFRSPNGTAPPLTAPFGGEVGDADYYDAAGAMLIPAERMRRWVVPADINGTGQVFAWNPGSRGVNNGFDALGRVEFNSYFRPPGSPGMIATSYTVNPTTGVVSSTNGATLGAIYYPQPGTSNNNTIFYGSGPSPSPAAISPTVGVPYPYLPDLTSNPLHSLEAGRFPNQGYYSTSVTPPGFTFTAQNIGGAPIDLNIDTGGPLTGPSVGTPPTPTPNPLPTPTPTSFPTYDYVVNASVRSDGLNDADETNLYVPNKYDTPYTFNDLQWLYRQQDVDGATLTSNLKQLAPASLTNGLDGARRRRLFSVDSWDLNSFSFSTDNPAGQFPNNSQFNPTALGGYSGMTQNGGFLTQGQSAGFPLGYSTPGLAQRDKKINLNLPLPVSNDPDESVRKKWITDVYYLLKQTLPPRAVDTPEELAQLSQYVINIVDFRDTDCTMTHWVNPDVVILGIVPVASTTTGGTTTTTATPSGTAVTLASSSTNPPVSTPATYIPLLEQWGMEYNPVAINEVLAYSYLYVPAGSTTASARANRFFMELVNTQTSPEISYATSAGFNTAISLGGYVYNPETSLGESITGVPDPYPGAPWDIVFTGDDPYSRPDPYRGQLVPYANLYAVPPRSQSTFASPLPVGTTAFPAGTATNNPTTLPVGTVGTPGTPTDGFDVVLPASQQGLGTASVSQGSIPAPGSLGKGNVLLHRARWNFDLDFGHTQQLLLRDRKRASVQLVDSRRGDDGEPVRDGHPGTGVDGEHKRDQLHAPTAAESHPGTTGTALRCPLHAAIVKLTAELDSNAASQIQTFKTTLLGAVSTWTRCRQRRQRRRRRLRQSLYTRGCCRGGRNGRRLRRARTRARTPRCP